METKVHDEANGNEDRSGGSPAADLPFGDARDARAEHEWFEPPRDDSDVTTRYEQLRLPAEAAIPLTGEERDKVNETLTRLGPFEGGSPAIVQRLRTRIDEWTSAIEIDDRRAAVALAVGIAHQLHRIALDADQASSPEEGTEIRETARWWTFRALALLDSCRWTRSGSRLVPDSQEMIKP